MGQSNPLNVGGETKRNAKRQGQCPQRLGKTLHATFDNPDPFLFHMGHKHQGSGRREGRRTAIGRISTK